MVPLYDVKHTILKVHFKKLVGFLSAIEKSFTFEVLLSKESNIYKRHATSVEREYEHITSKTGQQLYIRWEECMQKLIEKYDTSQSEFLLPIINPQKGDESTQYQNATSLINRKLKHIGKMVGLQIPLTMYVARHSWASVAKDKNIPLSIISDGMGHTSVKTTQIYLTSIDSAIIDNANSFILKSL